MRTLLTMSGLVGLLGSVLLQAEPAPVVAKGPEAVAKAPAGAGLLGKVAKPEEIFSASDTSEIDLATGTVVLSGNAKVWDNEKRMQLSADRIVLTSNSSQKLVKVEAVGAVVFVGRTLMAGQETEVKCTGGYAVYQVADQVLTLTEKPRIEWGRNVVENMEKVIYNKKTGKSNTAGGTTGANIFPADLPKSKDEEQPAAPAAKQ